MRVDAANTTFITDGFACLRGVFEEEPVQNLRQLACDLFAALEDGAIPDDRYRYNRFSSSLLVEALPDSDAALTALLRTEGMHDLVTQALGGPAECRWEQCWLRKKYAPRLAPRFHQPHTWHQDGALGVRFDPDPSKPVPPMTPFVTCWVPLDPCDGCRPGIEFVRQKLETLLHYSKLDDTGLRARFAPEQFDTLDLAPGDLALILNGTLHRTIVRPEMDCNRLSLDLRFFPRTA